MPRKKSPWKRCTVTLDCRQVADADMAKANETDVEILDGLLGRVKDGRARLRYVRFIVEDRREE